MSLTDGPAQLSYGEAGEAITQGQPVYASATSSEILKADASALASSKAIGIAVTPAADGEKVAYVPTGEIDVGATLVVGKTYVVSDTSGAIAPIDDVTTGWYVTILGTAITTGKLRLGIQVSGIASA